MSPREVPLKPGWLARDCDRALRRIEEWSEAMIPSPKPDFTPAEKAAARDISRRLVGRIKDTGDE